MASKNEKDLCGLPVSDGEIETIQDAVKDMTQAELQAIYFELIAKLEKLADG